MPISLRGKAVVSALKIISRMNPDLTPHPIARVERLSRRSKWHYTAKRTVTVTKEKTENGIPFVRLKLREPLRTGNKKLFYIHGGVFIADLHPFYINVAERIMRTVGCDEAVLPDYRTLPEHSYPTQLEDVKAVWNTVTSDIKPDSIVISGDSAGGNLALALLLMLRDEKREMPKGGAFFSPWLDMLCMGESYLYNYDRDAMFGNKKIGTHEERRKRLIESEIFSYAKALTEEERSSPYVSPVYGDYRGMPPTFFAVGEDELLRSDTETVVAKLKAQNTATECETGSGMFHIYALFPVLPESRKAFQALKSFAEKYF